MSEHREGTLFYDTETGRYDIRFDLESFYGGLDCGECFDVKVKMFGFRSELKWEMTGIWLD